MVTEKTNPQKGRKKNRLKKGSKRFWILFLTVFCLIIAFMLSDCSLHTREVTYTHRAAIVIRGPNDFFQQWVTKAFTVGVLNNSYSQITYYNQKNADDKKVKFISKVTDTLKKYPITDIFLLGHGTRRYLFWVENYIPKSLRRKIRLVYHSGCGSILHGKDWIKQGAISYVGHGEGMSWSPVFFYFFLRRWVRGYTLYQSVKEANMLAYVDMRVIHFISLNMFAGTQSRKATKAIIYGKNVKIDSGPKTIFLSKGKEDA